MKFVEKKRDSQSYEEWVPGQLVPDRLLKAQNILNEVALWLGFKDSWEYNNACEPDQHYKARRRLQRRKVK